MNAGDPKDELDELDELEVYAAAYPATEVKCKGPCRVVEDQFVGSGAHTRTIEVRPLDANGNPKTWKDFNGKTHEVVLHIGYLLSLRKYVGQGNANKGLQIVQEALARAVARRTEIGCRSRKCRCGKLVQVKVQNIWIKSQPVDLEITSNGSKYRFTYHYPTTVQRIEYKGTCEDAPLGIHVGEFGHPG